MLEDVWSVVPIKSMWPLTILEGILPLMSLKDVYPSITVGGLFRILILGIILWKIPRFVYRYSHFYRAAIRVQTIGPVHPLWGNLNLIKEVPDYFELIQQCVQKTRTRTYVTWITSLSHYFGVCHPETAKLLLKSSEPKPKGIGQGYRSFIPWLGDGLLLSEGAKWERNRRLLTPAFHFDILKSYVKTYNEVADILINKLLNASKSGKSIEIYELVGLATLDTMLRCSLSYDGNIQQKGDSHPYVRAVRRLTQLCLERTLKPWLFMDWMFILSPQGREFRRLINHVHAFADDIIERRRSNMSTSNTNTRKRLDFLDILLVSRDENGSGLSDRDIRAEVDTFLFEGHDTTASAVTWALYCCAKYPEEQEKIYQELTFLTDNNDYMGWDSIKGIDYLNLFIKETMRMYSPVPMIGRRLTKPVLVDNVLFPKDSVIEINISAMHHHPDVFPDHMEFRTDRFLDANVGDNDPFSFVPFSAGPRNCIGQNFAMNEQRVLIARVIRRFKIKLDPQHETKIFPEVVTRPQFGVRVILEEREPPSVFL
ncbi:cytochrome P450 4F8-like [Mizuhopecten yessoensis]|uniref:Cytochrome P450 4F8 n=1 Tax=Mizuhopecten yessoensis TaxID=6573 RepID=A0A210Q1R1_MIZYE|nr:cytochrome P450 4F8-like [Mizuhopecten yessoensis]XP_021369472.1 cytochrome P450 4F8-like [Mizuhopecten yessoensis]XP_021369474.1 cytochrome P450 4F8-like [Mizuhopecten yessoensis]XP_021369475.1 cytochrome P450 4F8-like [Mizuhopecten yessoensis]OWF42681.1 Cytochrome P450 4F8 [Mizuhopecten yessoensis]